MSMTDTLKNIKAMIPEDIKVKLRPIKRKIKRTLGLEKPVPLHARANDKDWGKSIIDEIKDELIQEIKAELIQELVHEIREEIPSMIRQAKIEVIIKKLIAPVAITLAILTWLLIPLKAEARSYNIDKAQFDINIISNGDALVTETWTLDYTGEYSRFYKEFNQLDITNIEKCEMLLSSVKINGIETSQIWEAPSNRVDNTYYIEPTPKGVQLNMYKNANNEVITYEMTYILKGIVKGIENGDAILCYRLIGQNFEANTDSVEINISGAGLKPELDIRNITNTSNYRTSKMYNRYKISIDGHESYQLLKLNIGLNKEAFTNLETLSVIDLEKSLKNENKNIFVWIVTIAFMLCMASPFIYLGVEIVKILADVVKNVAKNTKYKLKTKKNPRYMNECFDKVAKQPYMLVIKHMFTDEEYGYTFNSSFLKTLLLSLKIKGILRAEDNNLYISYGGEKVLTNEEVTFIRNMLNIVTYEADVKGYKLNIPNLSNLSQRKYILHAGNAHYKLDKEIRELFKSYAIKLKAKNAYNELKEAFNFLDWYIKYYKLYEKYKTSTTTEIIESNIDISISDALIMTYIPKSSYTYDEHLNRVRLGKDPLQISSFSLTEDNDYSDDPDVTNYRNLIYSLDIDWYESTQSNSSSSSSSSSGSSCSSCSSCSGCGGGGAD